MNPYHVDKLLIDVSMEMLAADIDSVLGTPSAIQTDLSILTSAKPFQFSVLSCLSSGPVILRETA